MGYVYTMKLKNSTRWYFAILVMALGYVSCSQSAEINSSVDASTSMANESEAQGLDKFSNGYNIVTDPESGVVRAVTDRKNPFGETETLYQEGGQSLNKQYQTSEYDAKRWQQEGKKSPWKPWSNGDSRFEHSPEFVKKNADIASKKSDEAGRRYDTSRYQTASAYEATSSAYGKKESSLVQQRREAYVAPKVVKHSQYSTSGRSVEDVKSLLNE